MIFTEEELEMRRFRATAFYQEVVFKKLEDVIVDKQYRISRACRHLGQRWATVKMFLSTEQKQQLTALITKYGKNGGRRLRYVKSMPKSI